MSQRTLEAHYRPNWRLAQAHGLAGYNCGYAERRGGDSFGDHQQALVWRLIGDTVIDSTTVVLDIGSGIGGPAGWIMRRYHPRRLIGVEYLWSSVTAASGGSGDSGPRPAFLQADAQRLPIADGSVDVVFNLESALHYPDKAGFVGECRRVLRPGGTLCLGDITTDHRRLFSTLSLLNKLPSQFNSNVKLWSTDDYRRAFAVERLNVVRHEEASQPVANALEDGLLEVRRRGWTASVGYRGRYLFLAILARLLRRRNLKYDLFLVRRPA